MRIILVGTPTDSTTQETIQQSILNPTITSIILLSQTRYPPETLSLSPKISQVIHEDFSSFPSHLASTLSLSSQPSSQPSSPPEAEQPPIEGLIYLHPLTPPPTRTPQSPALTPDMHELGVSHPLRLAEFCTTHLAPQLSPPAPGEYGRRRYPFKFIFLSVWGAERDGFRRLWVWGDVRRVKGAAEGGLFEIADSSQVIVGGKEGQGVDGEGEGKKKKGRREMVEDEERCFEVVALRPGKILGKGEGFANTFVEGVLPACSVDKLARFAVKAVIQGRKGESRVVENGEILGGEWAQISTIS